MRTRILLIAGAALALLGQSVYPPMVGGEFQFAVMQPCPALDAQGVPLTPQGLSVGIEPSGGGVAILCLETPVCDTRYEGNVKITATGQRQSWVGRAFSMAGCVGFISEPSAETAYTYPGMKPDKPKIEG